MSLHTIRVADCFERRHLPNMDVTIVRESYLPDGNAVILIEGLPPPDEWPIVEIASGDCFSGMIRDVQSFDPVIEIEDFDEDGETEDGETEDEFCSDD